MFINSAITNSDRELWKASDSIKELTNNGLCYTNVGVTIINTRSYHEMFINSAISNND